MDEITKEAWIDEANVELDDENGEIDKSGESKQ